MEAIHSSKRENSRSRNKRHRCGPKEYFDHVVEKCSLCKDVCEAKIRLGLECQECKGYVPQALGFHSDVPTIRKGSGGGVIFVPVIILVVLIAIVSVLIVIMARKLHHQRRSSKGYPVDDGISDSPLTNGEFIDPEANNKRYDKDSKQYHAYEILSVQTIKDLDNHYTEFPYKMKTSSAKI